MSFNLIPGLRGNGNRRASDKVTELRRENVILLGNLHAAGDDIALLQQDLDEARAARVAEKRRRETAEKALAQAEDIIRLRDQRIADLERKVDVGVKAEHVIAKTQELDLDEIRRHCVVPVPLSKAPFASTDPAHVPVTAMRP